MTSEWVQVEAGRQAVNMSLVRSVLVGDEGQVHLVYADAVVEFTGDGARRLAAWVRDQRLPIVNVSRPRIEKTG